MRVVLSVLTLILGVVTQSNTFTAVKAASPPSLDSITAQWRQGVAATDFFDFTDRRPTRYATQAYLLYDDKYLYVAFHCQQAGAPVTAAQRIEHAGVGNDDHVGFGIDTAGNGSRTYEFRVNPLGIHDEASTENARYAPNWQSTAHVDSAGNYDAFFVIPLSAIRAQGGSVQRWRFNFERFIAAANADQTWAYSPTMQSITAVQYWPWLTGIRLALSATHPKPQADAYVLQSAGSQANVFQNGIGQFEQMHARPVGLDVTYPFTNTLAFVGTLNPDFSNVEEDQTTIQPQEFQKAYQEYRPFFAQGAQYINALPQISLFGGGNIMFYSPAIGVFDRGLKVEGTAGNSAVGLLNVLGPGIDDNAAGYAYASNDGELTLSAQSVLANHDGIRDDTGGVGLQRVNRHSGEQTQMEFAAETGTDDDGAHDFNFSEGLQNQHFTALAYYRDTSAGYHPLDGYTAVSDARGPGLKIGYAGTGSLSSPLLSYSLNLFGDRYLAADGSVRQADFNGFYNVQFKNLLSLQGFFGPSELQTSPGIIQWFNRRQVQLGYAMGTPQPLTLSYTWGPFAGGYVQQTQFIDQRVFGRDIVSLEYDGNIERASAAGPVQNSQWLRRFTFSRSLGNDASVGVQLRGINGTGGFAEPGTNLSLLYQQRFANQDLLYVEYGTPAAQRTLNRFILKYVFHAGGETGT
jgi:hypothetical protein